MISKSEQVAYYEIKKNSQYPLSTHFRDMLLDNEAALTISLLVHSTSRLYRKFS